MIKSNNIIDCKCQAFPYTSCDTSSIGQAPPEMGLGEGEEDSLLFGHPNFNYSLLDECMNEYKRLTNKKNNATTITDIA